MKLTYRNKNKTYDRIIRVYLLVCIIGLAISIPVFNNMITKHDLAITNNMCGLTAEKLNNSISYITESVKGRAQIISSSEITNWNTFAKSLKDNMDASGCNSIGLIDENYNLYCEYANAIRVDFTKWGLVMSARKSDGIYISHPYRQSMSGRMVFTIFAPIIQEEKRAGELFMTYWLEEIQDMASSKILEDKLEIYLMNPYSNNYIKCFGGDETQIGSWNNTKLFYDQIKEKNGMSFRQWEKEMCQGNSGQAVFFEMDGVLYTQVFVNIDAMDDWSVVVRIPNYVLSENLRIFHILVIVVITLLIIALFGLFVLATRNANAERSILEYMSAQDPLTKLSNRRAFEKIYEEYMDVIEANRETGALIFFDIDYFKQVNDGYGHAMGDRVLIEFAKNAVETFGENAVVSRFGGDEFIILYKNLRTRNDVEDKLHEFRTRLQTLDFLKKAGEDAFKIHYSAGVVEVSTRCTLEEIERKADKALYIVKQQGRNGFEWYSDDISKIQQNGH